MPAVAAEANRRIDDGVRLLLMASSAKAGVPQVNAGVDVLEERAEFVDAHTLKLVGSGKTITADKVLIAVGGSPWRPSEEELPGVEHTITSDGVFQLKSLPKHIVIAGGGYIACEFAHVFAGLGVETCLV